jgi:hypothetical protein
MSQEYRLDSYPSCNQNSERHILSGLYSADDRLSYSTDPYDYNIDLPEIFDNQSDTLSEEVIQMQQIIDDFDISNNDAEPVTQFFLPALLSKNIVYDPHICTNQTFIYDVPTPTTITPTYHNFGDESKTHKKKKRLKSSIRIYYNPNYINEPYKYKISSYSRRYKLLYTDHELLFSFETVMYFSKLLKPFHNFMKGKIIHKRDYFNLAENYPTEKLLEDLQIFAIFYA